MSLKNHQETYTKIKKRLTDYKYRSIVAKAGVLIFALLLVLSLFPLVPIVIVAVLGYTPSSGSVIVISWFGCIFSFGLLFAVSQYASSRLERKRGITLDERLFIKAYDSLCCLKEFLDPQHPVLSSKQKAIRRLWDIVYTIGATNFPDSTLVRDEAVGTYTLSYNLSQKLIPQLEKYPVSNVPIQNIVTSLESLIDYLSEPHLTTLLTLNQSFSTFPSTPIRKMSNQLISSILKPSNGRHIVAFGAMSVVTLLITYVGISIIGVTLQDAYTLAVASMIGLVAIYVTYLGLTSRQKTKTDG